jgi:acetyl esterase/lipase
MMPTVSVLSIPRDPSGLAPATSAYYPQPIPISHPTNIVFPSPIWDSARSYQYGPFPEQQLWVFLPAHPNGRLNLIVHGGGLREGSPTSLGIDGFAQLDLDEGTTLVSIGYRLLDNSVWPAPVDDIAKGIGDGYEIAQKLTRNRITDITETGLSAGGTALALINYSPDYPTTAVRPNRLVTISAPLETNASSPAKRSDGFRYTGALRWDRVIPKTRVPITLMGTPGDPVAMESSKVSTIDEFARYLKRHGVKVATYFDPYSHGVHGSIAADFLVHPDVEAALERAYSFG